MSICVVALGKIGLPLAVQFAMKGHRVMGVDISPDVVAAVTAGRAPFPGEAHLDERLNDVVSSGLLTATTDTAAAVAAAETVVIVVPLLVDGNARPDFNALDGAVEAVARALRPHTLVSIETTMPVGTTRGRIAPKLVEGSGLSIGRDLFVCHSPERVYSGRIFQDLRRYPKLVGALDEEGARRAVQFYEQVLDFDERADLDRANGVWDLGSAEAAELAKLAETTYRDVNIALANEFAVFADRLGVDVKEVIAASNSQPFSHIHQPGIAVGGHCIPVYPRFYLSGDEHATLPAAARNRNDAMPEYAVELLERAAGSLRGRSVAVLGAAYRGDVKETAFSGVFGVVAALERRGAIARVHDPLYSDEELIGLGFVPHSFGSRVAAAIVQADHAQYRELRPEHLPGVGTIVDGRRVLDRAEFERAGITIASIGGGRADDARSIPTDSDVTPCV